MNAEYLFQQDKQYDLEYDTGDKTIQCGRRNDIFKLWLTWRAKVFHISFHLKIETMINNSLGVQQSCLYLPPLSQTLDQFQICNKDII